MTTQSSYVLEATGWHIIEGHSDWMSSDAPLASRDDVVAAYTEVDSLIHPDAHYRIIGMMQDEVSRTEYTPVEGGTVVRLVVSAAGMSVDTYEICVATEVEFGLVESCDCSKCAKNAAVKDVSA